MYHRLFSESSILQEVELADQLRLGFTQLQKYILYGESNDVLKAARKIFRSIREQDPTFKIAYLYEGIALDLLEAHNGAIALFKYLQEDSSSDLKEKSLYNEAISRFRKYRSEEIEEAIKLFDQLIGKDEGDFDPEMFVDSPVKAFSLAGKANAIAHKPIFWKDFMPKGEDNNENKLDNKELWKSALKSIENWKKEVLKLTGQLEKIIQEIDSLGTSSGWDNYNRKQLEWLTVNAEGNVYLNIAINYYDGGKEIHLQDEDKKKRKEYLEDAQKNFHKCEILMPPRVETLTNLATVHLYLSDFSEARRYCESAIELNPNYEYAYYRLAQSWFIEEKGKKEGKKKVLEVRYRFIGEPKIRHFKELVKACR